MTENRTIQLTEIPIGGKGGLIWNRLHAERENICEALITPSPLTLHPHDHQSRLQARLRRIDDALDRLMSGSYGLCSSCGHSISDDTLEVDPAWSFCMSCSGPELSAGRPSREKREAGESDPHFEVILKNLNAFDTIVVHTHYNDYRILLLDPKSGRALVEGGSYFLEPSDGFVRGSLFPGADFNVGAICVGGRLEMSVSDNLVLTSPIKGLEVKHNAAAESLAGIPAG